VSRRRAGALAGVIIALIAGPPAGAAPPPRDAVLAGPGPESARISAGAVGDRYSLNDGSGATVAVTVSAACRLVCTDADPQRIANLIGGLLHGPEVERLTVQLDAPFQVPLDCGSRVTACYYPSRGLIVLSGNDEPARDGASRALVLAHEYGHHLASSRVSPVPFPPPLLWGTPRWASHEDVCRMRRAGQLVAGSVGADYYEDPGEAFAEAYGRVHFPSPEVEWKWVASLKPGAGALRAIREDALDPWTGRTSVAVAGRAPAHGVVVRSLPTPLDGTVTVQGGRPRHGIELGLRSPLGALGMARFGSLTRPVDHTVCGESRLGVVMRSLRDRSSSFRLRVQRP